MAPSAAVGPPALWGQRCSCFARNERSTSPEYAAEEAGTFHELRGASERYARVLGPNTLRVLILLATWKAGAKGKEAMTGSGLLGFPQAVHNAASACYRASCYGRPTSPMWW